MQFYPKIVKITVFAAFESRTCSTTKSPLGHLTEIFRKSRRQSRRQRECEVNRAYKLGVGERETLGTTLAIMLEIFRTGRTKLNCKFAH